MINDPKILLCDEPTSALDPLTAKSILALIEALQSADVQQWTEDNYG